MSIRLLIKTYVFVVLLSCAFLACVSVPETGLPAADDQTSIEFLGIVDSHYKIDPSQSGEPPYIPTSFVVFRINEVVSGKYEKGTISIQSDRNDMIQGQRYLITVSMGRHWYYIKNSKRIE